MKRITDLLPEEAKAFFLKQENYCTFDLPLYFTFDNLLQKISKKIKDKNLSDFYSTSVFDVKGEKRTIANRPEWFENVNYKLINNKNGQYTWRILQLIHPVIYVSLVHKITDKNNWGIIVKKLADFGKTNVVECLSLPVISEDERSDKATQIGIWLHEVEKQSIALSLKFEYLFHTDIVDCYGSIYTHSITWAIHTKEIAKMEENRDDVNLIGVFIDKHIQAMSYGQTNGIPQGSILMDFIAEIVLGYVDSELTLRIKNKQLKDFKILRYRDDYRIFVNNPETGKEIIKFLSEVLADVGMKINSEKTKYSNNVVYDSIKADKLFFIQNYKYTKNIQNELLVINNIADNYPNSGSLIKLLQNFFKRIECWGCTNQNIEAMIGILMNIAYKNPRTYPITSSILSKFLSFLSNDSQKQEIIKNIIRKFSKIPNTELLNLWIQRIILPLNYDDELTGTLCKKVIHDDIEIWNNKWLSQSFAKLIDESKIIDKKKIQNLTIVVDRKEVAMFDNKEHSF